MIKTMHLCKKKGITHEECIKYHREIHAPLAKRLLGPRMKRYAGYYIKEAIGQLTIEGAAKELPFDFIAEVWFDDEIWNNMPEFQKSPDGRTIARDEENFIDRSNLISVVFEDNVIVQGEDISEKNGADIVKTMHFDTRRKGMTHEECIKHHREIHAPLTVSVFGQKIKRYVGYYLKEAIGQLTIEGLPVELPFDFIPEVWFDCETWENMAELHKSPEFDRLNEEENEFIDPEKMISVVFEDAVFVDMR